MDARTTSAAAEPFTSCPMCRQEWRTRGEFVQDPGLSLLGLQRGLSGMIPNLLLFNHTCGTTLAIRAARLPRRLLEALTKPAARRRFA